MREFHLAITYCLKALNATTKFHTILLLWEKKLLVLAVSSAFYSKPPSETCCYPHTPQPLPPPTMGRGSHRFPSAHPRCACAAPARSGNPSERPPGPAPCRRFRGRGCAGRWGPGPGGRLGGQGQERGGAVRPGRAGPGLLGLQQPGRLAPCSLPALRGLPEEPGAGKPRHEAVEAAATPASCSGGCGGRRAPEVSLRGRSSPPPRRLRL